MTTHEQHQSRGVGKRFAEQAVAGSVAARDEAARWDPELFRRMGGAGLLGACLPVGVGGSGWSAFETSELLAGFGEGSGDAGLALSWSAHLGGCAVPLLRFGSPAQRACYLGSLGAGSQIGTLAHLEPEPAATPVGIATRAVRSRSGWTLFGTKTWVANGTHADLFVVSAVTDVGGAGRGVSTFLVPRKTRGVRLGRAIEPLGYRTAGFAEVVFDGCELPGDALLGTVGRGLEETLWLARRWERTLLYAPWVGVLRRLFALSLEHVERARYGASTLKTSQLARASLADSQIGLALSERMLRRSASLLDAPGAPGDDLIAAGALFLAQSTDRGVRAALSLHGLSGAAAHGIVERSYRDAAMLGILGVGQDVLRSVVAECLLRLPRH